MLVEVKAPNLGEEGPKEMYISFWMFEVGDVVSEGEDLVELVTDKANFTVPSPASGRLVELRVEEGAKVSPDDVLAVVESNG
jgi:pyruvate/2-oxoglutarate dehydrogenase complex dihydrolipoamide acyltransferase (E2) component